jgi:hypothetical protein
MSYQPTPPPLDPKELPSYLDRELRRVSQDLRDNADVVAYRTLPVTQASLSAGMSANWKVALGNVLRVSCSVTQTFTGIQTLRHFPMREVVFLNVGVGTAVLTSEDAASSASARFALVSTLNLSLNAAATLWYDPLSSRIRCVGRT